MISNFHRPKSLWSQADINFFLKKLGSNFMVVLDKGMAIRQEGLVRILTEHAFNKKALEENLKPNLAFSIKDKTVFKVVQIEKSEHISIGSIAFAPKLNRPLLITGLNDNIFKGIALSGQDSGFGYVIANEQKSWLLPLFMEGHTSLLKRSIGCIRADYARLTCQYMLERLGKELPL